MEIIIDTREQLPLTFTGHETIRRKLDEGDYNIEELEDKIVIERKSLPDLYQSITSDHQQFKKEILRARDKGKTFYIFIEGTLQDFYFLSWSDRPLKITPAILEKIITTMKQRYNLIIVECNTRKQMSKKIVQLMNGEE
jgi:ERCC4-type nuclease